MVAEIKITETPAERTARAVLLRPSAPAYEWMPAMQALLDELALVRQATDWDACSECHAWAGARDQQGRGLECCAVLCAGCSAELDGEDCERDADGRAICDACAADRREDRGVVVVRRVPLVTGEVRR